MRYTKIIATLGPATDADGTIEALIAAGVNVVRLNFSHGTHDSHRATAARIREAAARAGREVAILQDLAGPKIRIGKLEDGRPLQLQTGETLRILTGDVVGRAGLVSTIGDYARFLQMLQNGGELDGRRLLKAATVSEMTKSQIGNLSPAITHHGDKFGYGFGVVTRASKPAEVASIGSYSWGGIFYTYFLVDPDKELLLLCTTQVFPFDHLTLHGDFKQAVYAALER